jgi:hypothetical protein
MPPSAFQLKGNWQGGGSGPFATFDDIASKRIGTLQERRRLAPAALRHRAGIRRGGAN